ncbi:hypothetical protein CerSpe_203880 [Prunus speciosa]
MIKEEKKKKGEIFMERDQSAAASNLEIKVVRPRRNDNVVHPAGQAPRTTRRRSYSSNYNPFKRWVSWLVPSFVVANIVVFVVTMFVNDCPKNSASCIARFLGRLSFQPLKENPLLGPSSATLEKMGALDVQRMVHKHQAWRMISFRIGLLYVLSGFGGSLLSSLFIQYGISVGASGALFGLLGSMLSEIIANWTMYENKLAALLTLIVIVIVNLAVGILPHVDNFAHIGGFLSGFLLGFVFLIRPQFKWLTQRNAPPGHVSTPVKSKHKTYQYVLWVLALILLIVGFTIGMVTLLRGVNLNDYCSWCHYLSCVPTSKWSCKSQQMYCLSSQLGNQLNLTCVSNGRNGTYSLLDGNPSRAQQLCAELCS